MTWSRTWRRREIAIRDARWWRDGELTVDRAVVDPKPCNDHFEMFGLYAARVRDESGVAHQIEVVRRPWLAGRTHYQLVVDGVALSRGPGQAPDPPDWALREETEMQGRRRFLFLYWRSALLIPVLFVVLRYFAEGFESPGSAAWFALLAIVGSVAFHGVYASARWRNMCRVNRCRRRKLFGASAAQPDAAAGARSRDSRAVESG